MILTGPEIRRVVESSHVVDGKPAVPYLRIEPYSPDQCGPNSYDVTLAPTLTKYHPNSSRYSRRLGQFVPCLDPREPLFTEPVLIPADGFLLEPGDFYLGAINEWIDVHGLVPYIDGRSTIGRLSISIHQTAGRGDDGYRGRLTLEIHCLLPVVVYPNMPIGQLTFHTTQGERQPYAGRYLGDVEPTPARPFTEAQS